MGIPPDIKEKAVERRGKDESKYDAIDYDNFSDYVKMIMRHDNWRDPFRNPFKN